MSLDRRRFLKTTAGAALAAPALINSAIAGVMVQLNLYLF